MALKADLIPALAAVPDLLPERVRRLLARHAELAEQRRQAVAAAGGSRFAPGPARPGITGDPAVDGPAREAYRAARTAYSEGMSTNAHLAAAVRRDLGTWATRDGHQFVASLRERLAELAREAAPYVRQVEQGRGDLSATDGAAIAATGTDVQVRAYRKIVDLDARWAPIRQAWLAVLPLMYPRRDGYAPLRDARAEVPVSIVAAARSALVDEPA